MNLGVSNAIWRVPLWCPRTLLQGCGYGFKPTKVSDRGIVVVVRGSKLSMKTVLLSPKSDAGALIGIPPYDMTCRMPLA